MNEEDLGEEERRDGDDDDDDDDLTDRRSILKSSSSLTMDYRIMWIREKVLKSLGLQDKCQLFDNLINENDRYLEDKLLNFLILDIYGVMDLDRKQVFFYKTYHEEVIQEEIVLWEERKVAKVSKVEEEERKERGPRKGKRGKGRGKGDKADAGNLVTESSTVVHPPRESIGEEEEEEEEEEGGGERQLSFAETKKRADESFGSLEAASFRGPPPGEEDKYVPTKKVIEKVVRVPDLDMFCGEIDGNRLDLQSANLVYCMRTSEEGIRSFDTFQECKAEITDHLVVGSLNGRFLLTFYKMLTQVFKPLVDRQFREPTAVQRREECGEGTPDRRAADGSDIRAVVSGKLKRASAGRTSSVTASQSAAFAKPSGYRRMSMSASRMEFAESSADQGTAEVEREVGGSTRSPARSKRAKRSSSRYGDGERRNPKRVSIARLTTSSSAAASSAPSLSTTAGAAVKRTEKKSELEVEVEPSKNGIQDYLAKLTSTVAWTLEHTEGDILLTIPKIPELTDPRVSDEAFCANKKAVEELEEVVIFWGRHIQKVLDSYVNKVPRGKGPMAEYDYWHDRETGLSMLVEQLKIFAVRKILSILNRALSPVASAFDYFQMDLWKHYVEARDNNKFLLTMLRHFKTIDNSDSFETITETIPLLMDVIKMIWVLSKYYCTEDKMVSLLERISWQLGRNVTKNLAVDGLFRKPLEEILRKTKEAYTMTRSWKLAYLDTREKIEISGKIRRWEFDQRRLFKETEYIASVCSDLNEIASILKDFYNIFGPDLKSIIDDPAQIDAVVRRVGRLVVPIQEADFDVFDEFNKENWEATMSRFYAEVSSLENEAKFFIDECFTVLISAEEALELLIKFKSIKTRAAIQEQLLSKFDVIVQQLSKEIGAVENIFNRGKRNPPLLRYHPPVAGAIYWQRQLFHRLKRPVITFQTVEELKQSELKPLAFGQYFSIAKQMKHFESSKYSSWVDGARFVVSGTLKKKVLRMVPRDRERIGRAQQRAVQSRVYPVVTLQTGRTKSAGTAAALQQEGCPLLQLTPFGSGQRTETIVSKQSLDTSASGIGSRVVPKVLHAQRLVGIGAAVGPTSKDRNATTSLSTTISERQLLGLGRTAAGQNLTWKALTMQGAILVEHRMRFEVNFNWDVFEVIREAELLEHMGFELPSVVRDVGVRKDRLQSDIEATMEMIGQFNGIVDRMDSADIQLLKRTLRRIEKHIQPGITRLNWYSLGIADYATACGKLLKDLASTVVQVDQTKKDLDQRIEADIESYNLFTTMGGDKADEGGRPDDSSSLHGCKAYFLSVEQKRTELICAMLKAYRSASPMLIKLESLVDGTSTGRSSSMQLYYEQYEHKIFTAFITCFVRNLDMLNKLLTGTEAVFQVDAILVSSEVVLRPSPGEIYTIILHDVKDLLERMKVFPRWMNGTCIECKPIKQERSEEFVTFSYFEDIMSIQIINDLILTVQDTAHKLAVESWRYLQRWKKYGNLWFFDKNQTCEKFAAKNPTLLQYDEKFTFYGAIVQEVDEMTPYYDINGVRINLVPLLDGIKEHGKEWRQVLGNYLLADTLRSMNDFKTRLEHFRSDVELVITGLDRFKLVMQTITDIKKMAVQAEVRYHSYQETFRTLRIHEIDFADEDEEMAYKLQHEWESLYLGALYRGTTLESTKDRFSEMTKEQIVDLTREFVEFAKNFESHGPGSVGNDLDAGMKMMEEYGKLIDAMEARRLDLVNAEILFDLPLADYSPFLKIKKDYEGMEMLYKLYKIQKTARDAWSKTLWANLNPLQLIDGMEQFIKEFRKLPRTVRMLNVGQALEDTMKSFKNSVPLFVELKNEAMRERHWIELMEKTGKHFDMSADRFGDQ